ncbi:WXG100 family type VII secretion target [Streptomyces sp. NRRL WC-3742]|uniref:WXG100 family type VII secretion target n=1 Tax=Streptomyces sp. NRRL WC-3742 TaxID=1463934 RepID=UPI00099B5559|nr:WXG100 family type VII secretion target [Streptomyces sp. NRRL WC-3742]
MGYTNFNQFSHAELRKMAKALNPGAVMAAGDPWHKAAETLKDIRQRLAKYSSEAVGTWEGPTSEAFHKRMLDLSNSLNQAAAYAQDAGNTLHNMSEAMAKAKRDMPEEPGIWDKTKDTASDFVDFVTGDGEDEHVGITARRKAEAAQVMQTLAMHYRIATPGLKTPPPLGTGGHRDDKPSDYGSQADPSSAAAAAAVVSGTAAGVAPVRMTTGSRTQQSTSSMPKSPTIQAKSVSAPTDSGIKGGTAQAPPKEPGPGSRDTTSGISGTPVSQPSGSVPSPATAGAQTSVLNTTPAATPTVGPFGGGGPDARPAGPVTGAPIVGPGGLPMEGIGPRDGRAVAGEVGRGAVAKSVAGPVVRPGIGEGAKQAFTEGGSGLGARGRLRGDTGIGTAGAMPHGVPMGDGHGRRRGRGKDGKRPDYLVEDEETWASDRPTNPNVVK